MKQSISYYLILAIMVLGSCTENQQSESTKLPRLSKETRMLEAMKHEIDRTKDPKTGVVPYEELEKAERYYLAMAENKNKTNTPLANIQWEERGPNNVGGRTRAILFLSATKVLAAGATGGLWVTDDITAASAVWTPIGDFLSESINISALAQDSANPNVLYAGTGEAFGTAHRGTDSQTQDLCFLY